MFLQAQAAVWLVWLACWGAGLCSGAPGASLPQPAQARPLGSFSDLGRQGGRSTCRGVECVEQMQMELQEGAPATAAEADYLWQAGWEWGEVGGAEGRMWQQFP